MKQKRQKPIEEEYGIDFISRFVCLYQAANVAKKRATEIGIDVNYSTSWIKHHAFVDYIKETQGDIKFEITKFLNMRPAHNFHQEPKLEIAQ